MHFVFCNNEMGWSLVGWHCYNREGGCSWKEEPEMAVKAALKRPTIANGSAFQRFMVVASGGREILGNS